MAPAWSNSDGHPGSFEAGAARTLSRHCISPHRRQRLQPRRGVTVSPFAQDEALPDASRELAGVDGRLSQLLVEHVLGVLVELEGLLPPLLLYQQDHQAAQGVLFGWILLQRSEEQLLGQAARPVGRGRSA